MSKIQASLLNGNMRLGLSPGSYVLDVDFKSTSQLGWYTTGARRPGETDQEFGTRIHNAMAGYVTQMSHPWLDGKIYPTKEDKGRFGRVVEHYNGWGELRKQKKSPHTEVLYVLALQQEKSGEGFESGVLVLRSINNCDNNQLREAIQLAGVRLEEKRISQAEAEKILDLCYAELQRRLTWTDRVKEKNRGKPEKHEGNAPVDPST